MCSSLPDLNWARLRAYESGTSEVLDMDGKTQRFKTQEEATYWLLEDEFISLNNLDKEDEIEYCINLSKLKPPAAANDEG